MRSVIYYYSAHHGNTLKLLEALAEGQEIDLVDVRSRMAVHPELYDAVGFASGIWAGHFHETVRNFAQQYLPEGSKVFLLSTAGMPADHYFNSMRKIAEEKHASILGEFTCKGFCTFGPFRLMGGIAKQHPDEADVAAARAFYAGLCEKKD